MGTVLWLLLFAAGPTAECDGGCECGCAVTGECRCADFSGKFKTYAAWKADVHRRRQQDCEYCAAQAVVRAAPSFNFMPAMAAPVSMSAACARGG